MCGRCNECECESKRFDKYVQDALKGLPNMNELLIDKNEKNEYYINLHIKDLIYLKSQILIHTL